MALRYTTITLIVSMLICLVASNPTSGATDHLGVVYKVGDEIGWSILGDYKKWASTKEIHVGDALLFAYNKEYHNLLEVNEEDYKSCNAKAPLAFHAAGLDSIPLDRAGNYYFICGRNFEPEWYALTLKEPGHCHAGQKLHVKVIESPRSFDHYATTTPAMAPSPLS